MSKLAIVGLGYVGLPVAILATQKNHQVVGIDLNESKIKLINDGISPIEDEHLSKALKTKPFKATNNFSEVANSEVVIIAVQTPVKDDLPDLRIIKSAVKSVAQNMREGTLVIIESTINPGVCDDELIPLIERVSGLKEGKEFYLAHCPERISPGDEWDLKDISRVVGSNSTTGLKQSVEFYETLLESEIKPMDTIKEAEAVKVVENSFRDINIAFVNELAMSFHRMGINLENVIDGASTKPFGYMPFRPGPGVGGHCIPVDPYYLIEYAKTFGFEHDFLHLARKINKQMPSFVVELTTSALDDKNISVKKAKIALLGLSYKANVADERESPAHDIKKLFEEAGAQVISFDPHAKKSSDVDSLEDALKGNVDVVVIATNHNEYHELSPNLLKKYSIGVLIDGRNMFKSNKEDFKRNGVLYRGIGQS